MRAKIVLAALLGLAFVTVVHAADSAFDMDQKLYESRKEAKAQIQKKIDELKASLQEQQHRIDDLESDKSAVSDRLTSGCPDCGSSYYQGKNPGFKRDKERWRKDVGDLRRERDRDHEIRATLERLRWDLNDAEDDMADIKTRMMDCPTCMINRGNAGLKALNPSAGDLRSTSEGAKSGDSSQPTTGDGDAIRPPARQSGSGEP